MIFYFSGTGNSRYVAHMLGDLLHDKVIDSNTYIKLNTKETFASEKPFVFVAPTYGWQMPHIFETFIKNSVFAGAKQAYFILTCGGDIGNAQETNRKLCNEKGLVYKGTAELIMPDNYLIMYAPSTRSEAAKLLQKAHPAIEDFARTIKENGFITNKKITVFDKMKSAMINPLFYRFYIKTKKFHATESCISCGKCVTVCPYQNIKLQNDVPVWGNQCTHCCACISYCPTQTIEYGKATVGRDRYHCQEYNHKK